MPDLTNEKVLLNYKLVDGAEDLVDFASGPNTNRSEDNYGIINVSFACGPRHNSPNVVPATVSSDVYSSRQISNLLINLKFVGRSPSAQFEKVDAVIYYQSWRALEQG